MSGAELELEEAARAGWYALIGRLFYDAPDGALLAELAEASPRSAAAGALGAAWQGLRQVAREIPLDTLQEEFTALFIGIGPALVTPYTSHYVGHTAPDRHLVRLREELARWGLARREAAAEPEDHVAGVCDVMRFLIESGQPLEEQRSFFDAFVYPGVMPLCERLLHTAMTRFYREVAALTRAFLETEKTAFEMGE